MKRLFVVMLMACAGLTTGCSDRSSLRFVIESITDSATDVSSRKPYIEADLVGNKNTTCGTVQDPAIVTVRLERPGSVGPQYNATITNVVVDYYFYNPQSGQLQGPIPLLSCREYNYNTHIIAGGSSEFAVPVATYLVKVWSQGINCSGLIGCPYGIVDRMVARLTVNAEDDTGKSMSAQGSILLYLYNYGPEPEATYSCHDIPTATAVAGLCSNLF